MPNKSVALFIISFAIGLFHFFQGFMSIFVFKGNEPLLLWVCMLSGPISTLPATIAAIFNRKIGGYWLISGGVTSETSFVWWTKISESWVYILIVTMPMILLGIAFMRVTTIKISKQLLMSDSWSTKDEKE